MGCGGPPRPWLATGAVTERPKVTVLKTVVHLVHRGFESHPLRSVFLPQQCVGDPLQHL